MCVRLDSIAFLFSFSFAIFGCKKKEQVKKNMCCKRGKLKGNAAAMDW